mgnify:FL=1|jgi:predicted dehydrogenase
MIRIGFIGTGAISRRHFTALQQLREQAEVVAVCDVVEAAAARAAAPFGARVYLSAYEMLQRERLDALYICLPPDAHVDQELMAAARGIHLFVEKPLPLDLAKAETIARAVQAAGIVTAVGYHWRYFSHTQVLRAALTGERVGLVLGYFLSSLPAKAWWRLKARSGGQVVEQAIHLFDLARYLLGEVEEVWAAYARRGYPDEPGFDHEDVYTVTMRFASGALASYAVSCLLHRRYLVGLDLLCQHRVYRLRESGLEIEEPAGVRSIPLENDPALAENAAFLHAIRTGDRSGILSDYADALKTQRVVMAANRAAETHQPVRVGL